MMKEKINKNIIHFRLNDFSAMVRDLLGRNYSLSPFNFLRGKEERTVERTNTDGLSDGRSVEDLLLLVTRGSHDKKFGNDNLLI